MKTFKLYINHYDKHANIYTVSIQYVKTNDIFHVIGKIFYNSIVEIKSIDFEEIK